MRYQEAIKEARKLKASADADLERALQDHRDIRRWLQILRGDLKTSVKGRNGTAKHSSAVLAAIKGAPEEVEYVEEGA